MNKLENPLFGYLLLISLLALSIVDNGIPAYFSELTSLYMTSKESLISLISYCSMGIVFGMIYFGAKIDRNYVSKLNTIVLVLLSMSSLLIHISDSLLISN